MSVISGYQSPVTVRLFLLARMEPAFVYPNNLTWNNRSKKFLNMRHLDSRTTLDTFAVVLRDLRLFSTPWSRSDLALQRLRSTHCTSGLFSPQ
jgi:hypothetical protein